MVAACACGQGKTTVTAALALAAQARGERVRVFKTGADFIDPMVLEAATGLPVQQLDLFMGGEAHCRALLWQAAADADLLIVEGVMGLFDGSPSSADLAQRFGLPVLAVIDAAAMAGTFGAIAQGLRDYRLGLPFAGVIANRVAGPGHARMLFDALPRDIPGLGWLPRDAQITLPERHLGLQADAPALAERLCRAAAQLQAGPAGLASFPTVHIAAPPADAAAPPPRLLAGRRIAIAKDAAFCFLYPANLALLRALGADCVFFSPLADDALPPCDALWLPGGYPELQAAVFAQRPRLRAALHAHQQAGKPLLAECGGMMSLFDTLVDAQGQAHPAFGLLPGRTCMHAELRALGLQEITLPEGTLRGHSFHHSSCETALPPIAVATNPNGGATAEAVYRIGRTTASYVHLYFPSNAAAVARLFAA
jgi:cobyrinic acid a,c-diamide synthase